MQFILRDLETGKKLTSVECFFPVLWWTQTYICFNDEHIYRQYTYIIGKHKTYLYELWKPVEKWPCGELFCRVSQRIQIDYIFSNNVGILYLSCNVKNPKATIKKSLKIPKWQSESVYRRRADNTMTKRKSTKGQTTIYKTYI